jgi:hypothetical protein
MFAPTFQTRILMALALRGQMPGEGRRAVFGEKKIMRRQRSQTKRSFFNEKEGL